MYDEPNHRRYKVVVTVKSVSGVNGEKTGNMRPCEYYRPGDQMVFEESKIEGSICYTALASMMYKIVPLHYGMDYPFGKDGKYIHICPDAKRPVVFEIERKV
jgi:uncharacterized repeat protein (TIGR04076 family)